MMTEAAEQARLAELREMENHRCPECGAPQGYVSLLRYERAQNKILELFRKLTQVPRS